MQSQIPKLSAPFIVSVTGHRDIIETDDLKIAFAELLTKLKGDAGTEDCILLSAIAEGADTLAADVAAGVGWQVIVPLPLPEEDYRRDFKGAALDKFNELLEKHKKRCFFIGYAPGCTPENTQFKGDGTDGDNEFRNRQYAYVGEFLTRHCEVLIAFWDGNDAAGMGGTGDVVHLQREGLPGSLVDLRGDGTLLDAPEVGRTFVIWSDREKHKEENAKFKGIKGDKEHGQTEEFTQSMSGRAEATGIAQTAPEKQTTQERRESRQAEKDARRQKKEDIRQAENEIKRRLELRKEWNTFVEKANKVEIFGKEKELDKYQPLPLGLAWKNEYLARVRAAYLRADELANRNRSETQAWFHRVLAIVLVFTVCIAGAGAFEASKWSVLPLVASWALLLGAYGIAGRQKKSKIANRQQDYRALCEAWRVAFFWRALGIEVPLDTCYLRSQRGELDWIRQALRTAELEWRADLPQPTATPHAFASVFESWIESQTQYFSGKFPADRIALTSLHNWSWAFLVLGLAASALQTLMQIKETGVVGGPGVWQFMLSFASADLLSSPFVPALLLVSRMRDWPLATNENTKAVRAATQKQTNKRRKLRQWFVLQNAAWTFVAIAGGLLALGVAGAILTGILPSTEQVPSLQMLATLCFFLPSLIFVAADYNALPEHVKNYERMFAIFARAEKMLRQIAYDSKSGKLNWDDAKVQNKARRVYRELGREALHENGEWLLIHRDRPLDVEA